MRPSKAIVGCIPTPIAGFYEQIDGTALNASMNGSIATRAVSF